MLWWCIRVKIFRNCCLCCSIQKSPERKQVPLEKAEVGSMLMERKDAIFKNAL
jgi:hypothetical protein